MAPRIALVAALALLALPARASVAVRLDLPALVAQADTVVRGRVVAERARWDASHSRIYTDVRLTVDRVYKGAAAPGDVIVVTRLGGSVGGLGMRVAGEARFALGEETIVFLRRVAAGGRIHHTVVGMAQGKLSVLRTASGPQVLSSPGAQGLRLVAPGAPGRVQPVAPRATVRPLPEVERAIAAAVAAGRRPGGRR
jgi:hypothetical protein